jgi:hypothetical protein
MIRPEEIAGRGKSPDESGPRLDGADRHGPQALNDERANGCTVLELIEEKLIEEGTRGRRGGELNLAN